MSTVQFAGFSRVAGALKFRTANDIARAQQLAKLGDTDISMAILPNPMTKNDAAKYVLTNLAISYPNHNTPEATGLLTSLIRDENPFAKPAKKQVQKKLPIATVKATNLKVKKSVVKPAEADITMSPKQAAAHRQWWMENVLRPAYEAN
jgi:hypothetical protein